MLQRSARHENLRQTPARILLNALAEFSSTARRVSRHPAKLFLQLRAQCEMARLCALDNLRRLLPVVKDRSRDRAFARRLFSLPRYFQMLLALEQALDRARRKPVLCLLANRVDNLSEGLSS